MNFPIQSLEQDHKNPPIESIEPSLICNICCFSKAQFVCTKCKIQFCRMCRAKSHIQYLEKSHKPYVMKLNETETKKDNVIKFQCIKHKKKYILYCKEHKRLVCEQCVFEKCSKHQESLLEFGKAKTLLVKEVITHLKSFEKELKITKKEKSIYDNHLDYLIRKINEAKKLINDSSEIVFENVIALENLYSKIINKFKYLNSEMTDQTNNKIKNSLESKLKILDQTQHQIQIFNYHNDNKVNTEKERSNSLQNIQNFILLKEKYYPDSKVNFKKTRNPIVMKNNNYSYQISKDKWITFPKRKGIEFFSNDQSCMIRTKNEFNCILGQTVYSKGLYEIMIKIEKFEKREKSNYIYLGFVDSANDQIDNYNQLMEKNFYLFQNEYEYKKNAKVGFNQKDTSTIYATGMIMKKQYGNVFNNGDIVRLFLDMNKHIALYKINSEIYHIAFKKLTKQVRLCAVIKGGKNLNNQINVSWKENVSLLEKRKNLNKKKIILYEDEDYY
ncbi:hypothetical protein M0813_03446 [Anaeramoeba flamelloides]|uniref:B box-type domain-containing protein n=1 Tax=Anaeramoeba flamelloides TaxID=1746091 RepID=A0ABQ8XXE7_9EUKA|nr:hypothetical protein M0813_03446 [Anaeramoeba flamelloides]